jgi:glycosyltransferase involved in cell wall biosynthesis
MVQKKLRLRMKIYLVIPAYNEEKQIGNFLGKIAELNLPAVVVDDGSKDKTWDVLSGFTAKNKGIIPLRHKINLGKGAAMKTGSDAAFSLGADAAIFMDSDGQHLVKDLTHFVKALNDGNDVVFGSRNLGHGVPLVRYLGNKFASLMISYLFGFYVSDLLCGFRALTKNAYKKLRWESRGYGVETEMVIKTAKAKLKSCEVPVTTLYYDKFKGVSVIDAFQILFDVFRWRLRK